MTDKVIQSPKSPTTELISGFDHLASQQASYQEGTSQADIGEVGSSGVVGGGKNEYIVIDMNNDKRLKIKAKTPQEALKKTIIHLNPPLNEDITFQIYSENTGKSKMYEVNREQADGKIKNNVTEL